MLMGKKLIRVIKKRGVNPCKGLPKPRVRSQVDFHALQIWNGNQWLPSRWKPSVDTVMHAIYMKTFTCACVTAPANVIPLHNHPKSAWNEVLSFLFMYYYFYITPKASHLHISYRQCNITACKHEEVCPFVADYRALSQLVTNRICSER